MIGSGMLQEIYDKNLVCLKDIDSVTYNKIVNLDNKSAYIEKSANGELNIVKKYNDKKYRLYSRVDPLKMSECICSNAFSEDADIIFIFGLGLCHELRKMLEKDEKRTYIIIEPDEDIFKVMLQNINIDFMVNSTKDIVFYVGKEISKIMYIFENVINELKSLKIKFVISPLYKAIYYPLYEKIIEGLRIKFNTYVVNINSINHFDKLWYGNYAQNIKHLKETCSVKVLQNILKGVPAVVCAAGPSITKNIEKLKNLKDNVLIVAVGSGISVLEANGIKAHIAGAMDGNYTEAALFKNLSINEKVSLFYSLQVNSDVLKETEECKFLMNQVNMDTYIGKFLNLDMYDQFSGSSIANVMAYNLVRLGCNPIIFLGQDLCYSRNKSYAEGATFYSSISDDKFEKSPDYVKVKNNKGEDVYTKPSFISMRDVMEEIVKNNPQIEFLNGSEEGLNINGTKNIEFEDYYDKNLSTYPKKDFEYLIKELHKVGLCENINKKNIICFIGKLKLELKNIIFICESIIETINENCDEEIKKERINNLEGKLEDIDFYMEVLKFSIDNIEFLTPKSYLERKLNMYLYAVDKCYIMMKNIDDGGAL